jgi:phosphohistidine phosphatase
MDFYLIRHAAAQALGEGGITEDADRPLTKTGKDQCGPLAAALVRHGVKLDQVVSSPVLRARQTAEQLIEHWPAPAPPLTLCDDLAPGGKPRKTTRFLRNLDGSGLAVVGHMPDLAAYAAWLIGSKKAQVELAKSGVARVRFEGRPGKGEGVLVWVVTPEWYSDEPAGGCR